MFEIGDLVRIKEHHLSVFDAPNALALVVKIDRDFYYKSTTKGKDVFVDRIYIDWINDDRTLGLDFIAANILEKVDA
jgi:hypothetical protein